MSSPRLVPALSCMALALGACSADVTTRDSGRRDGAPTDGVADVRTDTRTPPPPCVDTDNDGISDNLETTNDDDTDGMPNTMDDDSDGDGFTDLAESVGNYPSYASGRPALTCGLSPDDCDADGRYNFRDLDSDNDGLTDAEELAAGSNPCASDTDGDGVDDLTEHAAGSDPTTSTSLPPEGTLYVTLPYHPPGEMGDHPQREFTFSTRIRSADIMFLVDTTGSMGSTISAVQSTLSSTIIPGVVSALGPLGDARYGMAAHGDFAEGGTNSDGCMRVYQRLDANSALSQAATSRLVASGGGDGPESMAPATHALISGHGIPQYGGTATRVMNPATDCPSAPGSPTPFGWGCFLPGRVPVIVLFSDADWHNGPSMPGGNFYGSAPGAATYNQLVTEMNAHGAFFVGIDVGGGSTFANSQTLARATTTLDGSGNPIAFRGAPSSVAAAVVSAISTITGQSRQDITTNTTGDPTEMRLTAPHTTADFVRAVVPTRGIPDMPAGYDHRDMTTFYAVAPSTQVVFTVDFYNDFQPGTSVAQVFRATIHVLGRAGTEVDHRDVFIVVPADGGGLPG